MRAMLADVLAAVRETSGIGAVTLVSSEPSAPELAAEHRIAAWHDRGLAWNEALLAAMREVVTERWAAVVSADIPLVTAPDLAALLAATPVRGIAIARARDAGTNAVSMRPPAALRTCFGERGSAERHAELARAAGLAAAIVDSPGTALDLDTPEDVRAFLAVERTTRTRALLDTLAVAA